MGKIYFVMPLKSRKVARDWGHVVALFDDTIAAILSQTLQDIHVVVACHERPESRFIDDPRLQFVPVTYEAPTTIAEQTQDKQTKIRILVENICRRGGGYIVMMDADDLVSKHLAAYIKADNNRRGYSLDLGYILNARRKQIRQVRNFSKHCGSCAVFYLEADDILTADTGIIGRIATSSHLGYADAAAACNRKLQPVPFPAMIYIRHHGENLSVRSRSRFKLTQMRNRLFQVIRGVLPSPRIPKTITEDFMIRRDHFNEIKAPD
eukprot:gene9578-9655_t